MAIRFFHAADLHLDSPFKGVTSMPEHQLKALRESTFEAFQKLIDSAIAKKPDFVLIVGDIYDGEDRSLRAQHKFQQAMETLHSHNIPVFLCYGNHDHLAGQWTRFQLPPNVHVFPEMPQTAHINVRQQDVYITGFSYRERHIREPMIASYLDASDKHAYHIGMLHGSLMGDSSHAVYAPFKKEELLGKNYDYWALGHIHKRQMLHADPPIVYPGNLQSRHRNEKGVKGFYEVVLEKGKAEMEFIPASAIVYEEVECSCKGILHANEWFEAVEDAIEQFRSQYGAGVLELKLTDADNRALDMLRGTSMEEWLSMAREVQEMKDPTVWIQSISVGTSKLQETESNGLAESVISILESWDEQDWKEIISDVYQHPKSSRFMEKLEGAEYEQIKEEARGIILKELSVKE